MCCAFGACGGDVPHYSVSANSGKRFRCGGNSTQPPPAAPVLENSGIAAGELDQHMSQAVKRQGGSGDERASGWKTRAGRAVASRIAVADILATVSVNGNLNNIAPSNTFAAFDGIEDFSASEMADGEFPSTLSHGDYAPNGVDGDEDEDPALGRKPMDTAIAMAATLQSPTLLG